MKEFLKSILGPELLNTVRPFGHGLKGYIASAFYGFPATKLKIIAITGTKGKTSTTVLTGRLLNNLGHKAGYISTALTNVGDEEVINNSKMSSVDGILQQKLLAKMVRNKCEYAIIEMSSQGLEQNRDKGLYGFELAMFLNIYPEHIEAHGSFEKYLDSKGSIFSRLKSNGIAVLTGQPQFAESIKIVKSKYIKDTYKLIEIDNTVFQVRSNRDSQFKSLTLDNTTYATNFMTDFEVENLAFAIKSIQAVTKDIKLSSKIPQALSSIEGIPGRLEYVVRNNILLSSNVSKKLPASIDIMVDYAHETGSMELLLKNMENWKKEGYYDRIIHIVSCDGVGRDDWKKPILGDLSQKYSDYSIITTDNYNKDDNPQAILDMIAKNFNHDNLNKTYSSIINRKEAMIFALKKASELKGEKVIIVSTGVGTEQFLTQPDGMMRWDERLIWEMLFNNFV
jgi:UDP-N-acetylmuramoyl-L-alanyl-D-glutamate--2,6-diaminopimelate ligase